MWQYVARIFPISASFPDADTDIQAFLNEYGRQGFRLKIIQNYEAEFLIVMEKDTEK